VRVMRSRVTRSLENYNENV